MRARHTLALTVAGLITAAGIAVPAIAAADTPAPTSAASSSCPGRDLADYLRAHPAVAAELRTLAALPADQRSAARTAYLAANPEVAAELGELRSAARSRFAPLVAAVAGDPAALTELATLQALPADQREAAAAAWLAAQPGDRTELRAALRQLRSDARACRAGD